MSLFSAIINFFKSLFGGKTEAPVTPDVDITTTGEEKKVETEENKVEETNDEETTNVVEIIPLDDEDKELIANIVRPLIKQLNTDEMYINLCNMLCDSKVLKTYAKLSDDKMSLIINLTQSSLFNGFLGEFLLTHVVAIFKASIDAEFLGKYTISAEGGSIVIHKLA